MGDMLDPESAVRRFYAIFNDQSPGQFEEIVAPDYLDYGHDPAGVGPRGATDDYDNALKTFGPIIYHIDALVTADDRVAVAWTGHVQDNRTFRGLGLYRVTNGKLTETRNALLE